MIVDIRCGPDRSVLDAESESRITVRFRRRPFHGVISYGLRDELRNRPDSVQWWHRYAHVLDLPTAPDDDGELRVLRYLAEQHGVLSFSQSVACAARSLRSLWASEWSEDDLNRAELWNIKEGHVSSVWLVGVRHTGAAVHTRFILNVARDIAAGSVLQDTSRAMRTLLDRHPELPIAPVMDIASVPLMPGRNTRHVVVTRNEYVPRALEAHVIGSVDGTTGRSLEHQIVLIERFRTSAEHPAQVVGAHGRYASLDERERLYQAVDDVAAAASPDVPYRVDLNHGDLVWSPHGPAVVALS